MRPSIRSLVLLTAVAVMSSRCSSCTERSIHPDAIVNHDIGIRYLEQGMCVEADERCRLALEYGPNFEHPYNCLGMVQLSCYGDLDKAAQFFKDALAVNSDFAEAHNNLGTCFFRRNPPAYSQACDEFKAALEINPAYFDARENLGMCWMRQGTIAGDKGDTSERTRLYKKARSQLIRLLEMEPNNFNARHHLGFMDLMEGNYASAEQHFKRCLEIDPENPVCAYNLGNTYLKTARCGDAIEAFITALRDKQGSEVGIGARHNLGVAYEECAKQDGAIREFLDRIKTDPGNPTHHFDLGNIYATKGLPEKAVNEWQNTIKLDPRYCPAYFKLAMNANKLLNTAVTLQRCQDFVVCVNESNRDRPVPQLLPEADRCKQLVKKLQMQ